jgi:hypothetical protein
VKLLFHLKKTYFSAISLIFIKSKKKKQIWTLCKAHLVKLDVTPTNFKFYTVVHLQGISLEQNILFVDKTLFPFQNTIDILSNLDVLFPGNDFFEENVNTLQIKYQVNFNIHGLESNVYTRFLIYRALLISGCTITHFEVGI